ncbi:carboxylesterase [Melghiribacillus thermohalophilus]|uniref:Carboxylesterase n=1 Tax=Melghiribacillus thermohalophilus TaxID=1324956 RepID=A0A4R3MR45_9BACI|nr:carboxylesterase [Melghiribacillus thermohalophilus]TCT18798.1 carboxylesterase [Melghiribacillus thermohalophilus]
MKIKKPEPFTFEAGKRAVLLLHGFTGNSADVRMLGRFLQKKGYTSHAPVYRGHDGSPEDIIRYNPDDWWIDVRKGLNVLRERGHEEVAVAGLSMGGVFGLKLAYHEPLKGVITMCSPIFFDNEKQLTQGFMRFAREYKQLQRKNEEMISREIDELMENSTYTFQKIKELIEDVHDHVDHIYTPTFVVQGRKDHMINTDSANYIYEKVEAEHKHIKWYEESGHAITFDDEKDQLHEDIYDFLESLDWSEG